MKDNRQVEWSERNELRKESFDGEVKESLVFEAMIGKTNPTGITVSVEWKDVQWD